MKKLILTTAFFVGLCGAASASEWSDRTQSEIIDLHNQIDSLRSATTGLEIQMELDRVHQEDKEFAARVKSWWMPPKP